jgi:hypothetical protein
MAAVLSPAAAILSKILLLLEIITTRNYDRCGALRY